MPGQCERTRGYNVLRGLEKATAYLLYPPVVNKVTALYGRTEEHVDWFQRQVPVLLQRYEPSYHRGPFDNTNPCAPRTLKEFKLYELFRTGPRAYTRHLSSNAPRTLLRRLW